VGFIGWGAASTAMQAHLQARGAGAAGAMRVFAIDERQPPPGVEPIGSVESLFQQAELIIVDAEPAQLVPHLPLMRLAISDRHTLVMIGPGWSLDALLHHLHERKLMRCLVRPGPVPGQTLLAFFAAPFIDRAGIDSFNSWFGDMGLLLELASEAQFEVAQTLVDIAPAAFLTILDALADGALMMGLPRRPALAVVAAVLENTAAALRAAPEHPERLRDEALQSHVAATGLMEMESAGIRGLMMRVVREATRVQGHRTDLLKANHEGQS
jgi:pyrroline-5-carboxylate reductase